jgi:hypothetical protein
MATFKDVLEVKDRPYNRAVKVTVIAPKPLSRKRLEALAQQAWDAPTKTVTVGQITVKVEAFKR